MSFILDALKKLEQKKHQGSSPDILTIHDFPPEKPKKRSVWIFLLAAAVLLNAGVLLIWLHPWKSEKVTIAEQVTETRRHESTATESGGEASVVHVPVTSPTHKISKIETKMAEEKSLPEHDTAAAKPAVKQANVEPQGQPVQSKTDSIGRSKPLSPPDAKKGQEMAPAVQETVSVIHQPATKSLTDVNSANSPEQRVLERNELPLSVQQELPNITVTGHIYSNDPSSRIANINGQVLREGETVTAGLKLEEISENGVILSYKGYRFRMRGY